MHKNITPQTLLGINVIVIATVLYLYPKTQDNATIAYLMDPLFYAKSIFWFLGNLSIIWLCSLIDYKRFIDRFFMVVLCLSYPIYLVWMIGIAWSVYIVLSFCILMLVNILLTKNLFLEFLPPLLTGIWLMYLVFLSIFFWNDISGEVSENIKLLWFVSGTAICYLLIWYLLEEKYFWILVTSNILFFICIMLMVWLGEVENEISRNIAYSHLLIVVLAGTWLTRYKFIQKKK